MRERVRRFLAEYGAVGVAVYLVIYLGVFLSAWAALAAGWRPAGVAGGASAAVAAYLFTSLTKIPRFAAAVALTPLVARGWARVTGRPVGRDKGAVPGGASGGA
jgi:hypothetical protein